MVKSHFKGKRHRVLFAPFVHPEAREVAATYNIGMGLGFETLPAGPDGRVGMDALEANLSGETGAVVFQYPDYLGYLEDKLAELIAKVHSVGALAIVVYYPFAAGLLRTPGELGADIVCGEAQCLGNYLSYGGPYCGFLACNEELVRVLPGRLIGRTRCDRGGEPGEGFVMTLQAREQHIRRDKALSNICTNQALLALRVCIYLGAVGREGFRYLAAQCHETACLAFDRLSSLPGVEPFYPGRQFFNEFTLRLPKGKAKEVHNAGLARQQALLAGFLPAFGSDGEHFGSGVSTAAEQAKGLHYELDDALTLCFTESHSAADVEELVALLKEVL
jgi:glycine dehydrogenase subunit 1